MRTTCAVVLAAATLSGCASSQTTSSPNAEREIRLAQGALMAGETELALLRLEKARLAYRGPDPEYVTLLMAEAQLRAGRPSQALALAEEVLETDSAHPGANEVAGKAQLHLRRYGEAELSFLAAQDAYAAGQPEFGLLEDYVKLARGLSAYASADPDVAFRYWESIEDPQIRYALDQAVRNVASR